MITLAQARDVLGSVRSADNEGDRATNGAGGMSYVPDIPPPAEAARLPANWRNVLARSSWFAAKHTSGTNNPRACIMLDGMDSYAGTDASAISIPFELGGLSLPVFLPCEIAWHKIPGVDGARLWEDNGGYTLQTDAGIRVFGVRETRRHDNYPWHNIFANYSIDVSSEPITTYGLTKQRSPAYTRFKIEWLHDWVEALQTAPSDVLEIMPGATEVYARETRAHESPWPLTSLSFPVDVDGPAVFDSVWMPTEHMLKAFQAMISSSENGVIALRAPKDNVFLFAGDATAIVVPVDPVRAPAGGTEKLVAPKEPTTKKTVSPTMRERGVRPREKELDELQPPRVGTILPVPQ